jgi:hypothetical protein
MWVARADDGYLLGGLTRSCVDTLRGIPMLIESKDERVQSRLLPPTYDDPADDEQWRRHALPELERLFASRAQLVTRDLDAMRKLKDADSWVLLIPDAHVNAWLSSLNAARLSMFALHDLQAEHMEREGFATATPKQQEALLRIHLLAEVQCVLLGDCDDGEEPAADSDPAV